MSSLVKKITILFTILCSSYASLSATMYSDERSFMGPGTFYGPGNIDDSLMFSVVISNIAFSSPHNFITPYVNNGPAEPNICGEKEMRDKPTGFLSDGKTRINENVNTCSFKIGEIKVLVGIIHGGPHQGEQLAITLDDGNLIMTMDTALDMGIGEAGIIKIPFYGITSEVTLPFSLQTQMGLEGGIDQAGSLKSGHKLKGRIGDYNNDGILDGAIVVAGNIPLDSIILPGAPYAFLRYFETNIPYAGEIYGKLPNQKTFYENNTNVISVTTPK